MKLLRVGERGKERPAALLEDGSMVGIESVVHDLDPATITPASLDRIRQRLVDPRGLPAIPPEVRVGPPIARIGKIVCIGLNYREHAAEAGLTVPAEPIVFLKASDTVVGPHDDVRVPRASVKTDYEVELAIVIGSETAYLSSPAEAARRIAGYTVSNDVSEREFQLERGGQWDKGKNCATFNPLGPWLVTPDEVRPQELALGSSVNGEPRQDSTTADMIFSTDHLVWYVSQFMTLYPGDVINTGTPQGVGAGFAPPRFLVAGDVVELAIEGLGSQRQRLVAA